MLVSNYIKISTVVDQLRTRATVKVSNYIKISTVVDKSIDDLERKRFKLH